MPSFRRFLPILLFLTFPTSTAFAYQQVEFIQEFGQFTKKKEERLLNAPRAVAVAGERYYVADTDANRIVVLDKSGKVIQTWGQKGNKQGQLREPGGIAVDEQGRVYVSDTGNDRIQVFGMGSGSAVSVPRGAVPRSSATRRGSLYRAACSLSRTAGTAVFRYSPMTAFISASLP